MSEDYGKTYKLLGADGKFYQSPAKGALGGHRKLKLYGKLDCKSALAYIAKGQYVKARVFFANEEAAIAAGFRPCGKCMGEVYDKWNAGGETGTIEYPWRIKPGKKIN